jgi:hypothetical protein
MHCRAGKNIITTTSFYTVCQSINAFGGLAEGGKSFFQNLAYVDALRWFVRGFPIRYRRWNPSFDCGLRIADCGFEEWQKKEKMLSAVLDRWAGHAQSPVTAEVTRL